MDEKNLTWTKVYSLAIKGDRFDVLIANKGYDNFICHIIYYTYRKGAPSLQYPRFIFHYKHIFGVSEESVYEQCTAWIEENLNSNYKLELLQTISLPLIDPF